MTNFNPVTKIKVFGIGGGGNNAVNRMVEAELTGVQFYVANTDKQVLDASRCENKILLGYNTTHGLGAGGNPAVGKAAAEESREEIKAAMQGTDMVFIGVCPVRPGSRRADYRRGNQALRIRRQEENDAGHRRSG